MNHQIKSLSDSFSLVAECVQLEPMIHIGQITPTPLRKVIFKADAGNTNEHLAVDFIGQHSHVPAMLKPGKKYLVTMVYRGRLKDGKCFMSWQGLQVSEM